jgi:hypothetical protein
VRKAWLSLHRPSEHSAASIAVGLMVILGIAFLATAPAAPLLSGSPLGPGSSPAAAGAGNILPAAQHRFDLSAAGLSIDLPATWQAYGSPTPASGTTILEASGTVISMNVVWHAGAIPKGTSAAALQVALAAEVAALPGVLDPNVVAVALPSGPAVRASYRLGPGSPRYPDHAIVQYLVAGPGGDSYLLTFVGPAPDDLATVSGIAASLRLAATSAVP